MISSEDFKYVSLLIELHVFISEGRNDSEDADRIRDEMEVIDSKFTEDETQQMNEISAKLSYFYM